MSLREQRLKGVRDRRPMRFTFFYLALAFALCGCLKSPVAKHSSSVQVLDVTTMYFSNGPSALMIKYQTTTPLTDLTALRKEAGIVLEKFRPQVEKDGFKKAILSANDPPSGFIITRNSTSTLSSARETMGAGTARSMTRRRTDRVGERKQ